MPLEDFSFIPQLVETNPPGTDPFSQGDDHIRGVKFTLKNQFPGFIGEPVTVTEADLNSIPNLLVPGELKMFAGTTAPDGYLFCNGSAVSRTTYADLFAAIGETFGSGDGSTTFNLPDFRGRSPIGTGNGDSPGGTTWTLAEKDGVENVTLSQAQMSHRHVAPSVVGGSSVAYSPLSPPFGQDSQTVQCGGGGGASLTPRNLMLTSNNEATGAAVSAHENMPPVLGINFIIKT